MSRPAPPTPNWAPFDVCARGERPPETRSIDGVAGVGDRLRTAAFAELQAREAFLWAARAFPDAPLALRDAWNTLAAEEDKHLNWLLARMEALRQPPSERTVSDQLWLSLVSCENARDFADYMATAEERGRKAGVRFHESLAKSDPESAEIFGRIAAEEINHIALARRFFGDALDLPAV